ncbi:hypothetical protein F7725_014938 [Dissostichus mawsoni]|uniref:GDNF/GAS1 domain-containing protein n=1 Tax=Dissostichus mawsoni TaxID=36200 RepID=A0A7J5YHL4_DISMA|nr:hypothetical protein F7725_014938 [Dissostichus mawsoni]
MTVIEATRGVKRKEEEGGGGKVGVPRSDRTWMFTIGGGKCFFCRVWSLIHRGNSLRITGETCGPSRAEERLQPASGPPACRQRGSEGGGIHGGERDNTGGERGDTGGEYQGKRVIPGERGIIPGERVIPGETTGGERPLDCVRASELCNQKPQCSSQFRIMRQCLSGGGRERSTMLASRECRGALEVLRDSTLYDCRCKRGMKKELQCLQNYWSIHMGLTEDSSLSRMSPCSEAGKPCNPCLDAAKSCNLNETCKRLRSAYNSICSKATPPQPTLANQEPCSRKRCQKACAERRRHTIVPSCSHQERTRPSCLELRANCRSDALCRSRLADYHMNCRPTPHSVTSCPNEHFHGCLMAYVGLIGAQERECEAFHRDFTHNSCLNRGTLHVTEPPSTFLPPPPPAAGKHSEAP